MLDADGKTEPSHELETRDFIAIIAHLVCGAMNSTSLIFNGDF